MKPIELLKREPEKVICPFELKDGEIDVSIWDFDHYFRGIRYDHVPEVYVSFYEIARIKPSQRVIIKVYKDFLYDTRRVWRLCSVHIDDIPVMITQNAGREGDDHSYRFIVNERAYLDLVNLMNELIIPEYDCSYEKDLVNMEDNIESLDTFYGNALDDNFKGFSVYETVS